VGGEAKYRDQQARRAGVEAPLTGQPEFTEADTVLHPAGEIIIGEEVRVGLAMPVTQYAIVENALRAAEGKGVEDHRDEVAKLWAGMSNVAADNDDAWSREVVTPEAVRNADEQNQMLAFPYTKKHNSQWNVDQAGALVFCSVAAAERLGIARDRWVFPLAVVESNHMVPVSLRRDLHRAPGFAHAGARAMARAGCGAEDLAHVELYSCFPSAVRVQQRELGVDLGRPVTVTGGMAFAGGPLNNFVVQALVRMAKLLRDDPGSVGMVNAVSGIITKQGVSLWSTEPRGQGFAHEDVSEETARDLAEVELVEGAQGAATIASYTILEDAFGHRVVLLCDLESGGRVLAVVRDPEFVARAAREEVIGLRVEIDADGGVALAGG
jgi:acetyl-CoA C-acetyltransferase